MRRFSAAYLDDTRQGLWSDRSALAPLSLADRSCVVDVGCGTGAFARVLADESPGRVVGIDRDPDLLRAVPDPVEPVRGDALSLPLGDGVADLVTCQALLVNLPEPDAALREFRRVSSDLVAVVEPDNAGVTVESTVPAEARLTARAREHYIEGVPTDVTLGAVPDRFRRLGFEAVETRRHDHVTTIEPPYDERAIEGTKRKVTASRLTDGRETLLAGGLSPSAFDDLKADWKAMGRAVAEQVAAGEYRRVERVPFHVTVGSVSNN